METCVKKLQLLFFFTTFFKIRVQIEANAAFILRNTLCYNNPLGFGAIGDKNGIWGPFFGITSTGHSSQ